MSEILKFASESPYLTFFMALIASEVIYRVVCFIPNRILRHLNVRSKGWPPAHLDADGDWKPSEE